MSALSKLYSKLAKEIEKAPFKQATSEEWNNYFSKQGIKKEELNNWRQGLLELGEQPTLTKEQILQNFIENGDVPIRETKLTLEPNIDELNKWYGNEELLKENPNLTINQLAKKLQPLHGKHIGERSVLVDDPRRYEELALSSPWSQNLYKDKDHFTEIPAGKENVAWLRYSLFPNEFEGSELISNAKKDRVFHLDELQSKRHQEAATKNDLTGERFGYYDRSEAEKNAAEYQRLNELSRSVKSDEGYEQLRSRMRELSGDFNLMNSPDLTTGAQPEAPFKGDAWKNLGLRRALLEAADRNADLFSWSSGDIQNERWKNDLTSLYDRYIPNQIMKDLKEHGITQDALEKISVMTRHPDYGINSNEVSAVRLTPEIRKSILEKGFPKYMLPLGASPLMSLQEDEPQGYAGGGVVKKLSTALVKGVEDNQAGRNSVRDLEIYKNPSYRDALGIAEQDGNFALRTLYDKIADDVYVWPADDTLHDSIIRAWLMNPESGMKRHPSDFDRGLFELQGKQFVVPKDANVNPNLTDPKFWFGRRFEPEPQGYAGGGVVKEGIEALKKEWMKLHPTDSFYIKNTEVFKNPLQRHLREIAQNDTYDNSVRVLKDLDNNESYAWPASDMTHDDVARRLGIGYDVEDMDNSDVFTLKDRKLRSQRVDTGETFSDPSEQEAMERIFEERLKHFAPYSLMPLAIDSQQDEQNYASGGSVKKLIDAFREKGMKDKNIEHFAFGTDDTTEEQMLRKLATGNENFVDPDSMTLDGTYQYQKFRDQLSQEPSFNIHNHPNDDVAPSANDLAFYEYLVRESKRNMLDSPMMISTSVPGQYKLSATKFLRKPEQGKERDLFDPGFAGNNIMKISHQLSDAGDGLTGQYLKHNMSKLSGLIKPDVDYSLDLPTLLYGKKLKDLGLAEIDYPEYNLSHGDYKEMISDMAEQLQPRINYASGGKVTLDPAKNRATTSDAIETFFRDYMDAISLAQSDEVMGNIGGLYAKTMRPDLFEDVDLRTLMEAAAANSEAERHRLEEEHPIASALGMLASVPAYASFGGASLAGQMGANALLGGAYRYGDHEDPLDPTSVGIDLALPVAFRNLKRTAQGLALAAPAVGLSSDSDLELSSLRDLAHTMPDNYRIRP